MKLFRSPPEAEVIALLTAAGLPCVDVSRGMLGDFYGCGGPEGVVGVIGLEVYGDVGLLRSLAVSPVRQRAGHGRALVDALETHAATRGVEALYLLTETAERFFAKLGYQVIARTAAPQAIKTSREFTGLCPATATVMWKSLRAG